MYTVDWLPRALNQLATIWQQAIDKQSITNCVNSIDQRLARDPHGASESRGGNRRILFEAPLGVYLVIMEEQRTVVIQEIWYFIKRTKNS